jgi:DNA modification methylase
MGDSYSGSGEGGGGNRKGNENGQHDAMVGKRGQSGLKPKDLCGIPWRVAFALQADGWYLRQDIIWSKPNPMPESVSDRCTKAHEYMFLLTKSSSYFYDAEAIKEQGGDGSTRWGGARMELDRPKCFGGDDNGQNRPLRTFEYNGSRNKRSVWTVATAPYAQAHFATYPPDLIKPCILAGSRAGDTVLDPFAGSGTTGAVALELGRRAILIELNPKYIELIERRCDVTLGLALA